MSGLKIGIMAGAGMIVACIIAATALVAHGSGPIAAKFITSGSFAVNAEFPSTWTANIAGTRWASWNGNDAKTGVLKSTPFLAPVAVTLDVAGGTSKVNQQIEIVGPDGRDTTSLNTLQDAGERYIRVVRPLPPLWWGKSVTLRVTDGGGGQRGWTGVSDLRAAAPIDIATIPLQMFANDPWAYQLVVILCFALMIVLATRLSVERRPWSGVDIAFAAACTATICWMRWPIIANDSALNPDEALTTANAIKALHDIVPWRGFDGGTGGPLGSDILAIPQILGVAPTMVTTHIVGTMLVAGTAMLLFSAARCMWGGRVASIASLAYISFEALTHNGDFVHTSSELLPNALLAGALLTLAQLRRDAGETASIASAAIAGLLIGAMPFAKLQATPTAALTAAAVLLIVISRQQRRAVAAFGASLMLVPIILIGSVTVVGHFTDFLVPYILANASYASSGEGSGLPFLLMSSLDFTRFLAGLLAIFCVVCIAFAVRRAWPSSATLAECAFLGLLLLGGVFEALAPNRAFPHYLALVTLPASAFADAVAAAFADREARLPFTQSIRANAILAMAIAVFVLPQIAREAGEQYELLDVFRIGIPYEDAVARQVDRLVGRGASIAIWGWEPIYYVHSNTLLATHEASTLQQIPTGRYSNFYRKRFLDDIAASRPPLIIDAVAPGAFYLDNPAKEGINSFPAFARVVRTKYAFAGNVDGVRFYLRR